MIGPPGRARGCKRRPRPGLPLRLPWTLTPPTRRALLSLRIKGPSHPESLTKDPLQDELHFIVAVVLVQAPGRQTLTSCSDMTRRQDDRLPVVTTSAAEWNRHAGPAPYGEAHDGRSNSRLWERHPCGPTNERRWRRERSKVGQGNRTAELNRSVAAGDSTDTRMPAACVACEWRVRGTLRDCDELAGCGDAR
jgi:hypothetical protein